MRRRWRIGLLVVLLALSAVATPAGAAKGGSGGGKAEPALLLVDVRATWFPSPDPAIGAVYTLSADAMVAGVSGRSGPYYVRFVAVFDDPTRTPFPGEDGRMAVIGATGSRWVAVSNTIPIPRGPRPPRSRPNCSASNATASSMWGNPRRA